MHQKRFRQSEKGFTIIELLVSVFITALIVAALSMIFDMGLRAYRQGKDLLEITSKGQLILGQMTRELRGAMVQVNAIPFIGNDNGTNSVYFMAPVDNSSTSGVDLCELGYNLVMVGTSLVLRRHFLTADADAANYQYPYNLPVVYGESETEFADNVTSFNLRYFDGSNSTWRDTWDSLIALPQMVKVTVTIQGNYGSPPQSKTFTTWIYLPNST